MGYRILSGTDGNSWSFYQQDSTDKIFVGNSDQHSVAKNVFSPPLKCRFIRLNPVSWFGHISLRLEFYGCLSACDSPLGASNGALDNSKLLSSSDSGDLYNIHGSRLNTHWHGAKAWCAKTNSVPFQWIQIDVGYVTTITAVATQGRGENQQPQRVTKYRLDFSSDGGHTEKVAKLLMSFQEILTKSLLSGTNCLLV
eukprot:m.139080 g.139080  ORF g.139080 m.139080 type:complete len:197 (+) comp38267_c0_seq1:613-1203(+)